MSDDLAENDANIEQQLTAEVERLSQRVEELELELVRSQRSAALGQLVEGIAHDFNNLLQTIQGNISLMLSDIDAVTDEHVHTGAMAARNLLELTWTDEQPQPPKTLDATVASVLEVFARARKEIIVHSELGGGPANTVEHHRSVAFAVLDLLLTTAAAVPGGGDLYIRTVHTTASQTTAGAIMVASLPEGVGDSSCRQLLGAEGGDGEAMPVSLVAANRALTADGGWIMNLPVHGGAAYGLVVPERISDTEGAGGPQVDLQPLPPLVLIVDDESNVLDVGVRILERHGYRVLKVQSPLRAVEIFAQRWRDIDAVILDIVMPEMSGHEVLDRFRKINPEVKVLLASGLFIDGDTQESVSGCRSITKPYTITGLGEALAMILGSGND